MKKDDILEIIEQLENNFTILKDNYVDEDVDGMIDEGYYIALCDDIYDDINIIRKEIEEIFNRR